MSDKAVNSSIFDRFVGFFSPRAELQRLQARRAREILLRSGNGNGYEGASHGRRTQNWYASQAAANALIWGNLKTLRARCRDLVRNQPYAARGVEVIKTNTIGKGIIPTAMGPESNRNRKNLEAAWIEWGDETACDFDGRFDIYGIQALVIKEIASGGSILIRRKRAKPSDGLPVPLQLQVLESDYLDFSRDRLLEDGGRIMNGVQFDKNGRRVGYWLYPEHPGDRFITYMAFVSEFVPASEILHVFRVDRFGQCDGVPWLAPCVLRIKDLDEFEDAQLIRQKIAACFTAFVHDTEAPETLTDSDKDLLERVEPGMIQMLPPGKNVTFGNPPATQGYGETTTTYLRGIAAGLGITYESLTGDYSKVNFSSARMGALEMRGNIDQWQHHMIIPQLCKPLWRWFVEAAIMAGVASDYTPAVWTPPRREMIDPVKETEAMKAQIRIGVTPWSEAVQSLGKDPSTVAGQYEADNKLFDEKKFRFDSDPRKDNGTVPTNDTIHP